MAKKTVKKVVGVRKVPSPKLRPQPKESDTDRESKDDFGGLPDRDLKKNLGCG